VEVRGLDPAGLNATAGINRSGDKQITRTFGHPVDYPAGRRTA
jgi:hypothetical protein